MLQKLSVLFLVLVLSIMGSCRDDLEYEPTAGTLRFSRDTVFLDTVFNGLSSSTYNLKVYNTSNTDISIPEVFLERRANSNFRLNVNGSAGKEFTGVEIPAKDSIYIFIESTFDLGALPSSTFLGTDAIVFTDGQTIEQVELVTLIQDAVFLYPERSGGIIETIPIGTDTSGNEMRVEGFELTDDQLAFTAEKPYVIYGYAAVPEGKTLEIAAGARIHFHELSGILVTNGGSIHINGAVSDDRELMENEVIFEGDRLEPEFSDVPGQWGTLWLAEGSRDNRISHLTVRNATIGLFIEGDAESAAPKLILESSTFTNSSFINILARNTSVQAINTIAARAGQPSIYITEGGSYEFIHCTIANYWSTGLRSFPALLIDNFTILEDGTQQAFSLKKGSFNNCIVSGNASVEFLLNRDPNGEFNFEFIHCLLQFDTTNNELLNNELYDFDNTLKYRNCLLNQSPEFTDPASGSFELLPMAPAIDLGDPSFLSVAPEDITGTPRGDAPDAGAFEYKGN